MMLKAVGRGVLCICAGLGLLGAPARALAETAFGTPTFNGGHASAGEGAYWPGPATSWFEAHNSFGVTALGTTWGLAEGRVGGTAEAQTYILLANPGEGEANVTLQFLRAPGLDPQTVTKTVTVPPTSRFNVTVGPGSLVSELSHAACI